MVDSITAGHAVQKMMIIRDGASIPTRIMSNGNSVSPLTPRIISTTGIAMSLIVEYSNTSKPQVKPKAMAITMPDSTIERLLPMCVQYSKSITSLKKVLRMAGIWGKAGVLFIMDMICHADKAMSIPKTRLMFLMSLQMKYNHRSSTMIIIQKSIECQIIQGLVGAVLGGATTTLRSLASRVSFERFVSGCGIPSFFMTCKTSFQNPSTLSICSSSS